MLILLPVIIIPKVSIYRNINKYSYNIITVGNRYITKCNLCKGEDISRIDKDCNIFKCNHCGYIFDNPRPTFDEIKNFYSKEDQYDSWIKEKKVEIFFGKDV